MIAVQCSLYCTSHCKFKCLVTMYWRKGRKFASAFRPVSQPLWCLCKMLCKLQTPLYNVYTVQYSVQWSVQQSVHCSVQCKILCYTFYRKQEEGCSFGNGPSTLMYFTVYSTIHSTVSKKIHTVQFKLEFTLHCTV